MNNIMAAVFNERIISAILKVPGIFMKDGIMFKKVLLHDAVTSRPFLTQLRTGRPTNPQTDKPTNRQIDRPTYRQTDCPTNRTDRQPDIRIHREVSPPISVECFIYRYFFMVANIKKMSR